VARVLAEPAPDSSVVLAHDAARQACVAVLAQQGLRPTTERSNAAEAAEAAGSTGYAMYRQGSWV